MQGRSISDQMIVKNLVVKLSHTNNSFFLFHRSKSVPLGQTIYHHV